MSPQSTIISNFQPRYKPVIKFSFCENYTDVEKFNKPLLETFNNLIIFIKKGIGHLHNEHSNNQNRAKGEDCAHIKKEGVCA